MFVLLVAGPSSSTNAAVVEPPAEPEPLTVGLAVESRYGGGPDFYPGKIDGVNEDGTYVVVYADGDSEPNVKRLRIKQLGFSEPTELVQGMRCEARHSGGMKPYDGVVSKANGDETYVVDYDDGDFEVLTLTPLT